jgi:hypothetical protein
MDPSKACFSGVTTWTSCPLSDHIFAQLYTLWEAVTFIGGNAWVMIMIFISAVLS